MRLPRRITADAAAGLMLVGAAAILLATPYDGGSCRNVLAAYALPATSLSDENAPARPAALANAQRAVTAANAEVTDLQSEQANVDQAQAEAQKAREAATEAESDVWDSSYLSDYSSSTYSAQLDVDLAESKVESAEDWLDYVQDSAADTSGWAIYDQADVDDAQADVDDARANLAEAKAALADAQSEDTARESQAANAESTAEQLDAVADAAEQAAADAAADLSDRESRAQDRLYAARSRVDDLEAGHAIAVADWSHERRVAADEVTALNNVRASCRENGGWRAGVALLDVVLVGALVLRSWAPRVLQFRIRLPWRSG
jgi:hypothetical protein